MSAKKKVTAKYHHGDLRVAILAAALEMVAESGLESLSLREIARRIGVTTGAPYHHFKDRQSLLIELAIDGYSRLYEAMNAAGNRVGIGRPGAESGVEALAVAYLEFGRSHPALYSIMFSGELVTHPRGQEMLEVANRSLDLVQGGIAAGREVEASESVAMAFCAWSLLHGILMLDRNRVLREGPEEQERLALRGVRGIVMG